MTSRKSLPWYINATVKTLRTATAYAVQPVERDAAPAVRVPYVTRKNAVVRIPIGSLQVPVTAGGGGRLTCTSEERGSRS